MTDPMFKEHKKLVEERCKDEAKDYLTLTRYQMYSLTVHPIYFKLMFDRVEKCLQTKKKCSCIPVLTEDEKEEVFIRKTLYNDEN